MNKKKILSISCIIIGLLFMVPFIAVPFRNMFIKGVFSWHVSQPVFWRDFIELGSYILGTFAFGCALKKKKGYVVIALSILYLVSTDTIIQVVVAYLYLEVLIVIGESCLGILYKDEKYTVGHKLLIGMLIWGSGAIILSICKLGTINDLVVYTFILVLVALINPKFQVKQFRPLVIRYINYINECDIKSFAINMGYIAFILLEFARVNTHIESDSSWYCLYTDKCLFGENSFYDYLGYTDFVHYYPKFRELLYAPISGMGNGGYIIAENIWLLVILIAEVKSFITRRFKANRYLSDLMIMLIFTTEAIIGIASTGKSDLIGMFYIIMFFMYFVDFLNEKKNYYVVLSFIAATLSYCVKLTSFFYTTIIALVFIVVLIIIKIKEKKVFDKIRAVDIILCILSIFVFSGITYRTLKLTGYPTFRTAIELWDALGFKAKRYFMFDFDYVPAGPAPNIKNLIDPLLFPADTRKIVTQWIGNFYVFYSVILIFNIKKCLKWVKENRLLYLVVLVITFTVTSIYLLLTLAAPDGNYFCVPIFLISIFSILSLIMTLEKKTLISISLIAFVCLNYFVAFTTHTSWGSATRFTNEEIDFVLNDNNTYNDKKNVMKGLGVSEISDYIDENCQDIFVISDCLSSNICQMNARIETTEMLFSRYVSGIYVDNYEEFVEYIIYTEVGGFILSNNSDSQPTELTEYANRFLSDYGYVASVEDTSYTFYRLNPAFSFNVKNDRKTQVVYNSGHYDDNWCENVCSIYANSNNQTHLNIKGITSVIGNQKISIYVNGIFVDYIYVDNGQIEASIPIEKNSENKIVFLSDFNVEKNEQDYRDLSWILNEIELN